MKKSEKVNGELKLRVSITFSIVFLFFSFLGIAQEKKLTPYDYIQRYKNLAIVEMKRTGIPASITLAQGLLESSNGNSRLAKEANNHFGIKCKKDWQGQTMLLDDDKPQECFRVYEKPEESFYDHSEFISTGKRYSFLFKLDPLDYKGWANGLKEAGYATNPHYPELLINSIETYELNKYDIGRPIDSNSVVVTEKTGHVADSMKDFEFNGLPACILRHGDSIESVAKKHHIHPSLLRRYNDLCDWDRPEAGTLLYLKQKARTGTQQYYVVHNGEGMYMISQMFRIQLKQLYRKNKMACGMQPKPGEKIYLQAKRDSAPAVLPAGTLTVKKKEGVNLRKESQREDSVFKPDIILYRKVHLPEFDTTLPKRLDSTLSHLQKSIDASAREKRVHFDTLAKLPSDYKTPEDTVKPQILQKIDTVRAVQKSGQNTSTSDTIRKNVDEVRFTTSKDSVPVEEKDTEGIHIVRKGESLYSIARKFSISIDSLKSWNKLKNNSLNKGQQLFIVSPVKGKVSVQSFSTPEFHIVEKGESLFSIAKKYSLKVENLKSLNGIKDNSIKSGQKLKLK